jgi:hypothetical protein
MQSPTHWGYAPGNNSKLRKLCRIRTAYAQSSAKLPYITLLPYNNNHYFPANVAILAKSVPAFKNLRGS